MSESRIGKNFSEETNNILRELKKGKISPFKGKQHSKETKQKKQK